MISIIANNFNYEAYIRDCLDSCLRQTYHDMEIIVVDDGSTDNSPDIIKSYGKFISAIFKPNGGQASAFNVGFRACKGDVIVFLDSDDMLAPDCLESIAGIWKDTTAKVHFDLELIDENGNSLGENYCRNPLPRGDLSQVLLTEGNYQTTPTSGNAFARSFLEKVMPMPEAEWRGMADAYLFNLAPLFGTVEAIDKAKAFYRLHDRNLSSQLKKSSFDIGKCERNIRREINTEEVIEQYSALLGHRFKPGALTGAYPHLQQLMIHDKLARHFGTARFTSPSRTFLRMSNCLTKFKGLFLLKILVIHLWMFLVLIAPSRLAEAWVVFGYKKGAMLFLRRKPGKV